MHSQLLAQIKDMGHSEDATASAQVVRPPAQRTASPTPRSAPAAVKTPKSNQRHKAGLFGIGTGEDGGLKEEWDDYLPRPPSMTNMADTVNTSAEQVAVFNANTQEGSTMVRVLSEKGLRVVAAVRVFTSKNTKALIKLKGVTVKVADWSDQASLLKVAENCTRAFLVTKFWERFDSRLEEQMATNILQACATKGIDHLVLATFEDTAELRLRGRKSQIVPTPEGLIYPKFGGMKAIDRLGRKQGVQITHMMTSYLDEENQKKSLILIRGENKKIIVQPFFQEMNKKTIM